MRVAFLGSKALGLGALERLHEIAPAAFAGAVTFDDRTDVRSCYDAFVAFGARTGVPVHVAAGPRAAESALRALAPECCFVVGWYWLLSAELLASVSRGFIGVHNSLLPRYRGFSPLVWALLNGEIETGFSVFSLTAGMDDGMLWAQESVSVGPDDYVGDVLSRIEPLAITRLGDVYEQLIAGTATPRPQAMTGATYCAQRVPDDGAIDWTRPAAKVRDFVRALSSPYPGAFTFVDGSKLIIWRADAFDAPYHGAPGQVARVLPDGGVVVVAGDDRALVLREVERDGERGPAARFITNFRTRFAPSAA